MLTGLLHKTLIFFKDDNRNHTHTQKPIWNNYNTDLLQGTFEILLKDNVISLFTVIIFRDHYDISVWTSHTTFNFKTIYKKHSLKTFSFHILIFCLICSSFAFAHLSPRILLVNPIFVSCPWHQRTAVNNVLNSLSWCGKIKAIF